MITCFRVYSQSKLYLLPNYDHTFLLSDMNFFHLNISLIDTYQLIIIVWSRPIITILSSVKLVVRRMLSRKMFKSWHENVCNKNQELWISWSFNIAFEVMKEPFSTTCFKDFTNNIFQKGPIFFMQDIVTIF